MSDREEMKECGNWRKRLKVRCDAGVSDWIGRRIGQKRNKQVTHAQHTSRTTRTTGGCGASPFTLPHPSTSRNPYFLHFFSLLTLLLHFLPHFPVL